MRWLTSNNPVVPTKLQILSQFAPPPRTSKTKLVGLRNENIDFGYISQGLHRGYELLRSSHPYISSLPGCVTFAALALEELASSETLSAFATLSKNYVRVDLSVSLSYGAKL